jgi:hypothetical protein
MTSLAEIEPLKSLRVDDVLECATNDRIESVEAKLLAMPQRECPLMHKFAPGVYMREILMPRGTFIIGHQHNTEHFNIVLSGRAAVMIDGNLHYVEGPCIFVSQPGVRKVLYILEPMRWATVHPTDLTDLQQLEDTLITKSASFKAFEADMNKLKQLVDSGGVQ